LRKRIAEWAEHHERLTDDAFCIALGLPAIRKDAAISVRETISGAVRIPKELLCPNDSVCELETVGDPSHPSMADYFEDMWSIVGPKGDSQLVTVRDFVIEFAPKMP
jgi:hypothetical protein